MDTISYSKLRSRLKSVLDRLATEHEPLIVTRNKASKAILISYEDYKSLEETAYLLRSPKNAERLLRSLADANKGRLLKKKLTVSASGDKD